MSYKDILRRKGVGSNDTCTTMFKRAPSILASLGRARLGTDVMWRKKLPPPDK